MSLKCDSTVDLLQGMDYEYSMKGFYQPGTAMVLQSSVSCTASLFQRAHAGSIVKKKRPLGDALIPAIGPGKVQYAFCGFS